jgi:hypothetical protein
VAKSLFAAGVNIKLSYSSRVLNNIRPSEMTRKVISSLADIWLYWKSVRSHIREMVGVHGNHESFAHQAIVCQPCRSHAAKFYLWPKVCHNMVMC